MERGSEEERGGGKRLCVGGGRSGEWGKLLCCSLKFIEVFCGKLKKNGVILGSLLWQIKKKWSNFVN